MSPRHEQPYRVLEGEPASQLSERCQGCEREKPVVTSGESVHCRCDGTFLVHAPGIAPRRHNCFKVRDRVKVATSSWRDRDGQEGTIVGVDPPVTHGDTLYLFRPDERFFKPEWDKLPAHELALVRDAWCRESELVPVTPPQDGPTDEERLNWLDADPGRLEDVRGHYNNVEGCRSVREAIDAMKGES